MSQHQVTCFLFMEQSYVWNTTPLKKAWLPCILGHKLDDCEDRIFVRELAVPVEWPDDFDPTAQQIAALEEQKANAHADYMRKAKDINERISKLQALTFDADVASS